MFLLSVNSRPIFNLYFKHCLRLAGRLSVRRSTGRFENFKNYPWIALVGFSRGLTKVQCYYSVTNAFHSVLGKVYCY